MQGYRRNLVCGGTYFFTVNLLERSSRLLVDNVAALRSAVATAQTRRPFRIDTWVVLPDHMHCVWTLPAGDADYAARWRVIKARFSRSIPKSGSVNPSRAEKGERDVWQRRYWEHTIRDERDYNAHMDYVHFNPVKHGHVARPCDWPHSTFHRCVARGLYPAEWGSEPDLEQAGERA